VRVPPRPRTWLLVATLLAGTPVRAADGDACLDCHGDRVEPAAFRSSAHGDLSCAGCHTDIEEYPHPERPAAPDCATCHADAVAALATSVHGASADCAACHGDVHRIVPHAEPRSAVHWASLAGACARCHATTPAAEREGLPLVRPVEAYSRSVHARAVSEGRRAAVCSDCHGAHDILRPGDLRSRLAPAAVPETCGVCHAAEHAAFRGSVHGRALARGVRDAPTCTDCHGEHGILAHTEPGSPVFAANIPRETCGPCHGSIRLSERYGLPRQQVAAFADSFHGLALRAGQLTAANCASCHGVHDILPSADPRSHVHPTNLPATCGACHPGAGQNFALGPVHVEATGGGEGPVAWIRLVYLWLIGLVIASMAIHNLLHLARKARQPRPPRTPPTADAPVRMPRALRWQHGLVMMSFPVLVFTGFALTYPEAWWARPLLAWESRLGLRGLIHRAAGVMLLGAVGWHLVHLASSPGLRACLRGLLWSRRDPRDLAGMLAWALGRRAHPPRTGRFSYVEKAEYWAVLWGTALMGVTGLVLWFENAALRWLPKWAMDVVTALHFYEAVLATLAIVVWHFYWVIFDPDVYPMDTTWWTGRSPEARRVEREEADPGGAD
jgi:cytochrome b subunit of formate dehydrogenase